jgi:hypothetical protein
MLRPKRERLPPSTASACRGSRPQALHLYSGVADLLPGACEAPRTELGIGHKLGELSLSRWASDIGHRCFL